ncbi:MAG TPA: hypothetical protein VFW50_31970 [Streptosporangiaceae bacterium]|nr:hypothetical protein [Streptosporangiaceae bacterium]
MNDGWLDSNRQLRAAQGSERRLHAGRGQADRAADPALEPIAQDVAANLPIISTTTSSPWFEYNSQNYTGWPTRDNPYETGTNSGPGSGTDEGVILHLVPRRPGTGMEPPLTLEGGDLA